MVPSFSKHLRWDYGIISSLITNNIAPAANAIAQGQIKLAILTTPTPIKPPIGSTKPVSREIHKA